MPNESNNLDTVDLVSPEGELSTVPKANAAAAKEQGFTTPTPKQIQDFGEAQVYGDKFLTAGLAGAVRGALPFGAGAALLRGAGVDKETQEKLIKHNPASSATGEIAGTFTPYTGLLKIAGKAGKLASGAAKLVGLGEDAGLAGKIASTAVRGAAEGAAFGASKVANDAVIGDPELVASHALSEIGTSALWGAGIGGGLGLATVGIPKGISVARGAAAKIRDSLGVTSALDSIKNSGKEAFASVSSTISKVPKEKILEAFENMGKEEAPLKAIEFTKSIQELHNATESTLREAINGFEALTPETQSAIGDYLKSVDSMKGSGDFARQFMYKSKGELKVDPGKVETFLKNTKTAKGAKSAEAFSNYLESSGNLVDHLNHEFTLGVAEGNPDLELIRNLVSKNKGVLEEQQQAAMVAALGKHSEGHGGVKEFLMGNLLGHTLGIPHGALEAGLAVFEGLRNPVETLHKLGQLQQTVSRSAEKISRIADSLASGESRIGTAAKGFAATQSIRGNDSEKYEKLTTKIKELSENMPSTVDRLHANTAILNPHAPGVVSAMHNAAGRAVSFLASKIPAMTPTGPLAKAPEPSKAQIASFNRYYEAVENPISVFKAAQTGTLTHEGIEALQAVHPALFSQMKQQLMHSLANNKNAKKMPYQKKLMLSLLLGQDLDGSTNPISMHMNQAMLDMSGAQAEQKEQAFIGQPKSTVGGLKELSSSERSLTAQQKSSQRT